jgi:hypothetical protein
MAFGITTDYFGFADTSLGIAANSASNAGLQASEAQAMDSNGDVVASTIHDTGYGQAVSVDYVCGKASSIDFYDTATSKDFRGGKVINGYVITSISVSTSNTEQATVTISGQKTIAADSEVAKYDPGFTFTGGKGAQSIGYSTDTNTRLTGSSASFSVQTSRAMDSTNEELALDVYGGRLEVTHDLVGVTAAPGGAADTGFTLLTGPGESESNTEYGTGSAMVFKNISAS